MSLIITSEDPRQFGWKDCDVLKADTEPSYKTVVGAGEVGVEYIGVARRHSVKFHSQRGL